MSIHIEWDNAEKTVMRWDFDGDWSWKELQDAVSATYALYDGRTQTVDAILDLRRAPRVPGNAIANARDLLDRRHPRARKTVFVGASPIFRNLCVLFFRLYALVMRQKDAVYLFADTIEEARQVLGENNRMLSSNQLE